MYFRVIAGRSPAEGRSQAFLVIDHWDDWFRFSTMYTLFVFDAAGTKHNIGSVKIGEFGMAANQRRPNLPDDFDALDERFFSVGQDDSYYSDLAAIGPETRERVLTGLRDMALDQELFARALEEKVTGVSLLRSVSTATVQGQFHRIATGGVRLSRYEFVYKLPKPAKFKGDPVELQFVVEPESQPPTNIHVVIGRNGVGKTRLLNNMTRALVDDDALAREVGSFDDNSNEFDATQVFANIVSVTFSAFDEFEPLPVRQDRSEGMQYAYIGLKRGTADDGSPLPPRSPERLSTDFGRSVWVCRQGARAARWRRALHMLEADPIFRDAEVAELADRDLEEKEFKREARNIFGQLSSGHKIVLLTITQLVETVAERTLVLLDEPEAHLHPPLLSAFVRALSDLLINRNGVAIIATHSPVVLQEVPKSCAWKMWRSGARVSIERPEVETFGENVGILTREVFGLEVTESGFHKMLRDAVADGLGYPEVVERFSGELGGEGRAIARALIAARDEEQIG